MMRSGEYELRPIDRNSDSTAFLIYKKASGPNGENSTIMTMKPDESTFFKTGETIPSFAARDINGNKLKLSDLKGKVVVMNFWFIGCPPCRQEIPELNKIALDYANDPDVIFIAVGLDDRWAIRDFIKDHPFGYHIIENGRTYASMYGINPYPTSVILDKQGKVVFGETSFMPSTFYWIKKTINEAKQAAL
jgi:thiol-disulfide isomerase/thioredoxin